MVAAAAATDERVNLKMWNFACCCCAFLRLVGLYIIGVSLHVIKVGATHKFILLFLPSWVAPAPQPLLYARTRTRSA